MPPKIGGIEMKFDFKVDYFDLSGAWGITGNSFLVFISSLICSMALFS
jgi:hypothetical protein